MKMDDFIKDNEELGITKFPTKGPARIYFMCDGDGEILYIGRTMNIVLRMGSHGARGEFDGTTQYYFECPQSEYKAKEKELIKSLAPKINIKGLPKKEGNTNWCYIDVDKIKDRLTEMKWGLSKFARKLGQSGGDLEYTFYIGHTGPKTLLRMAEALGYETEDILL